LWLCTHKIWIGTPILKLKSKPDRYSTVIVAHRTQPYQTIGKQPQWAVVYYVTHCVFLNTTVTSWWLHEPPSLHEVRASFLLGRTLGSTIRSPLTGSDADHAAVQATGIEKSVVDGCGSKIHTDLRESNDWSGISNICSYRRDLACLLQFTSSRTVVASRHSFGGTMFASTGSHCNCVDFTVPEINRIVLFSCI
jgi:hypothetical protein